MVGIGAAPELHQVDQTAEISAQIRDVFAGHAPGDC